MPQEEARSVDTSYDFKRREKAGSRLRFHDRKPKIVNALSTDTDTTFEFELPNAVYNLAKSSLEFTLTIPAQGNAGDYGFTRVDAWAPIKSIELQDDNGVAVATLLDVDKVTRSLLPLCLPKAAVSDRPTPVLNGKYGVPYALDGAGKTAASARVQSAQDAQPALINTAYDEGVIRRYMISGDNTDMTVAYQLPFSDLFMSVFGVNRMLYWGRTMRLFVVFHQGNKFCGLTTSTTLANGTVLAEAPTIGQTLKFNMAQEYDPMMAKYIMSAYSSGALKLTVPVTKRSKKATTADDQTDTTIDITRAHGKKIRGVAVAHFHRTETGLGILSSANTNGAEVTSIRTLVNGVETTSSALTFGGNFPSVYKDLRPLLKGSAVDSVTKWEQEGAVHFENLGVENLVELYMEPTVSRGMKVLKEELDNSGDLLFQVVTPAGKNPNSWIFVLGEDELMITREQVSLGPKQSAATAV